MRPITEWGSATNTLSSQGARGSLEMNGQEDKPRLGHDQAGGRDGILQMGGWEAWGK